MLWFRCEYCRTLEEADSKGFCKGCGAPRKGYVQNTLVMATVADSTKKQGSRREYRKPYNPSK